MDFKLVGLSYLPSVMEIIAKAKELLKTQSFQWQNGYPNESTMKEDIIKKRLYGLFDKDELLGIAALIKGRDPNYLKIDGKWNKEASNDDLVIHRFAVSSTHHNQQVGYKILNESILLAKKMNCTSIKIDTHKNNIPMQKTILKAGFTYKGVVVILSEKIDNLRNAYELDL